MSDDFSSHEEGLNSPADDAEAVTIGTALSKTTRGLYVGVGGDISVNMAGTGTAIIFKGVTTGTVLPIRITQVNTTGTTATDMVGLY